MSRNSSRLALIGMMGAGKSTVAECLAALSGTPWRDLDRLIEARQGCSVKDIFATRGEPFFRAVEHELLEAVAGGQDPLILAVGGGTPVDPENQQMLQESFHLTWLDGPDALLFERAFSPDRPLAHGWSSFQQLAQARRTMYAQLADLRVDVSGKSADDVAEEIFRWWRSVSHG